MNKNVVWWTAIKSKLVDQITKYGGYDWFEYSRKTWEYWCEKNNCIFVPFENAIESTVKVKPTYQKSMFMFDEIERLGIKYDKIWVIDSASMIKWDCPNIFNLVDDRLVAWRDMDNLKWTYDSMVGYKPLFNNFNFDMFKYINAGNIIINKKHRDVFLGFKEFCYKNMETLKKYEEVVGLGTDQTPLNYWLQMHNVEMNLTLPDAYNLTHIHRREMFMHNWQLKDDITPFFIKYGYVWRFNGLLKHHRGKVMLDTWNVVKSNYNEISINFDKWLDESRHRDTTKYTPSRKFKKDVLEYFSDDKWRDLILLEVGCSQGWSTCVYSNIFKKVYAVDISDQNLELAKKHCKEKNNIDFIQMDLYRDTWNFPDADVVFIDAQHTYEGIMSDIKNSLHHFKNPTFIFDDYGLPPGNVKRAITDMVQSGILSVVKWIGEQPENLVHAGGTKFMDIEGVICIKN